MKYTLAYVGDIDTPAKTDEWYLRMQNVYGFSFSFSRHIKLRNFSGKIAYFVFNDKDSCYAFITKSDIDAQPYDTISDLEEKTKDFFVSHIDYEATFDTFNSTGRDTFIGLLI